jgi:hypothetical protein
MVNEFFELIRDPRIAEELILGMADIIHEKRQLEEEIRRLYDIEKKYNELFDQFVRGADQRSATVLRAALAGVEMGSRSTANA